MTARHRHQHRRLLLQAAWGWGFAALLTGHCGPVARRSITAWARLHPREGGDERLSGRQGESDEIPKKRGSSKAKGSAKDAPREKGVRRQRTADLGRALRSIYDDTLREAVPDDFKDLLGKLS